MKNLLSSAKFLALDMVSTLVLLAILKLTNNITVAACSASPSPWARSATTCCAASPCTPCCG